MARSLTEEERLFVGRLRLLMGARSEAKFAVIIGLNYGTFHRYLHGRNPSRMSLLKIANATGTSLDWLIAGKGPMRPGETEEEAKLAQPVGMDADGNREIELLKGQVEAGKREFKVGKREVEARKREVEAGKREVEKLKWQVELLKEMKQLPPPPTTGGDLADMIVLGLAECGAGGLVVKNP